MSSFFALFFFRMLAWQKAINQVTHSRTFCSNSTHLPQQQIPKNNKKGFKFKPKTAESKP